MTEKYFATKYDCARHEIIGHMAFEPDDWTGDVESPTGYVALVIAAGTAEEITHDDYARELAATHNVDPTEWAGFHLVTSTDRGFVYVESFETEQDARDAFVAVEAAYSAWCDDDDDDDEHVAYPHFPGYLIDCPACESACHCAAGNAECVFDGEHNGTADDEQPDREPTAMQEAGWDAREEWIAGA